MLTAAGTPLAQHQDALQEQVACALELAIMERQVEDADRRVLAQRATALMQTTPRPSAEDLASTPSAGAFSVQHSAALKPVCAPQTPSAVVLLGRVTFQAMFTEDGPDEHCRVAVRQWCAARACAARSSAPHTGLSSNCASSRLCVQAQGRPSGQCRKTWSLLCAQSTTVC